MNDSNSQPHPEEGYLDDDFARFRTARLKAKQSPPEPQEPAPEEDAEPDHGMFFGTTSDERRALSSTIRAEREEREIEPPRSPPCGVDIRKLAERARQAS